MLLLKDLFTLEVRAEQVLAMDTFTFTIAVRMVVREMLRLAERRALVALFELTKWRALVARLKWAKWRAFPGESEWRSAVFGDRSQESCVSQKVNDLGKGGIDC